VSAQNVLESSFTSTPFHLSGVRDAADGIGVRASAQGQPLWRRMGSYQLFQRFALLGQNSHRFGGQ
jgi:hypothetical protein